MNKNVRKLTLHRETLRSLEGSDVRGVAGGTDRFTPAVNASIHGLRVRLAGGDGLLSL